LSGAVLTNSFAGSVWTIVSRVTGLLKIVAVGAVLGATYLGNTYQSINSLPNLVYYQLLAGSLFASLLVPPLVRHIDQEDRHGAQRLVEGFLGTLLLVAAAASVILIALGPLIMKLLTLGVHDPATAAAQQRVGWLLLAMFVPQIALYIVAGCGAAAMNASGRFALAAAAPALESAGMIAVLLTAGLLFGTATGILDVTTPELLLLGLGTTAAVGLHATCQWLGARASGLKLVPAIGWRDPEVRRVLKRILPTLAFTGLAALQIFAVMIVANTVRGGFVAFQLALNFFYLPIAIVTWPIARAILPQLSRLHHAGDARGFRDEFLRGMAVASFVTVPIAVGYLVLAPAVGTAVSFGALAEGGGAHLMAISLASLAPGLVAETWFILGTNALYAQHDARTPLRSMAIRVGVSLVVMAVARAVGGGSVLVLLGVALSAGSLAGAIDLWVRLRRRLPDGRFSLPRSLGRTGLAATVMGGAVFVVTLAFGHGVGHVKAVIEIAVGSLVGLVVFGATQMALRAPELGWLRSSIGARRRAAARSA
jgi:putative peptidoglycan lipid II flippase